jgi:hypothetical protein
MAGTSLDRFVGVRHAVAWLMWVLLALAMMQLGLLVYADATARLSVPAGSLGVLALGDVALGLGAWFAARSWPRAPGRWRWLGWAGLAYVVGFALLAVA